MSPGVNSSQILSLSRTPVGVEKFPLELFVGNQIGRLRRREKRSVRSIETKEDLR
jgi:hypothetical protein